MYVLHIATPVIATKKATLTSTSLYLEWTLVGEGVEKLSLGHMTSSSSNRKRRDITDGYNIVMDYIPRDQRNLTLEYMFDLSVRNHFYLFVYEKGLNEPTTSSESSDLLFEPTGDLSDPIHAVIFDSY